MRAGFHIHKLYKTDAGIMVVLCTVHGNIYSPRYIYEVQFLFLARRLVSRESSSSPFHYKYYCKTHYIYMDHQGVSNILKLLHFDHIHTSHLQLNYRVDNTIAIK